MVSVLIRGLKPVDGYELAVSGFPAEHFGLVGVNEVSPTRDEGSLSAI